MLNKHNILLVMVITVVFLGITSVTNAAWYSDRWFSIDGWNGPMRLDLQASCASYAQIETYNISSGGTKRYITHNAPLYGWWQVTFTPNELAAFSRYWVTFTCYDSASQYVSWRYDVFYGNGQIWVSQVW